MFASPAYVVYYVVAMGLIGLHLRHGVSSAFQSLGVDHPRLTPRVLLLGKVTAVVLAAGFALIPVFLYLAGGRS